MLGIFDSGIGGLTVAKAIRAQAPHVDLVYFADIANMPYGNKSEEELEILTLRAMKLLRAQGATHLVSACNSISTTAVRSLIHTIGAKETQVTEMVTPTVRALMSEGKKKITLIATPATVQSGLYAQEFSHMGMHIRAIACPHLAELIEKHANHELLKKEIEVTCKEIKKTQSDILILGCTHYPFVKEYIKQELSETPIEIIDPAPFVASDALVRHGIQGNRKTKVITSQLSTVLQEKVWEILGKETIIERSSPREKATILHDNFIIRT